GTYSYAWGINDSGYVVGGSSTSLDLVYHAYFYNGSTSADLGALGTAGTFTSEANAINSASTIVGVAQDANYYRMAFKYTNKMTSVGTLGGNYSYAAAVN